VESGPFVTHCFLKWSSHLFDKDEGEKTSFNFLRHSTIPWGFARVAMSTYSGLHSTVPTTTNIFTLTLWAMASVFQSESCFLHVPFSILSALERTREDGLKREGTTLYFQFPSEKTVMFHFHLNE
jgi:hypothetical protein